MQFMVSDINPIAFSIGIINVYWYSLAYIFGVLFGWLYARFLVNKFHIGVSTYHIDSLITWLIIGILIGGRLGYVLFYNPWWYLSHPIEILKTYKGGMSFHGAVIGCIISTGYFARKYRISFFQITDIITVVCPIGLFLGRIANFINGELYGRVTDVKWAMIFLNSDMQPRHPSQLYEASLEGIILFIIMSIITFKFKTLLVKGFNSGAFLSIYSIFRILIENYREPDHHIGFLIHNFTIGQALCLPMLLAGLYISINSYVNKRR